MTSVEMSELREPNIPSRGRQAFVRAVTELLGPDYHAEHVFFPQTDGTKRIDKIVWRSTVPSHDGIHTAFELFRPVYGNVAFPDYTIVIRALIGHPSSQPLPPTNRWNVSLYGNTVDELGLVSIPPFQLDAMRPRQATVHARSIMKTIHPVLSEFTTLQGLRALRQRDQRRVLLFDQIARRRLKE